jgi:polysaccharide transporter, PST family
LAGQQGLKEKTIKAIVVQLILSLGLKTLSVGQTFVFARIFSPEDFGVLATAGLAISFVILFGQTGVSQALIRQKKNVEEVMNTAMSINFLCSIVLFSMIFFSAPPFAEFFNNPKLTIYIRFLSFTAFGNTLSLPQIMWQRQLRFGISKLPNVSQILCTFLTTIGTYYYLNSGIWSLFYGRFAGFIGMYLVIWAIVPYRPKFQFNRVYAKELYSFGWPLFFNAIFGYIVWQGDDILVSYFCGQEALGYYTMAFALPFYLTEIVSMVSAVLYPVFSRIQDSKERLNHVFTMSNKYLSVFTVPLGISLCIFAPQVIHYLYSDKWLPAVPLLQIFALSFVIRVATGYNWSSIAMVKGRTKYMLITGFLGALFMMVVGTFLIYKFGALGGALYNFVQLITLTVIIRFKILKEELGSLNYLKMVWKPITSGVLAGFLVYFPLNAFMNNFSGFIIKGAIFIMIYVVTLVLFERNLVGEAVAFLNVLRSGELVPKPK